jgi:uncharacterized membrane protein YgcG
MEVKMKYQIFSVIILLLSATLFFGCSSTTELTSSAVQNPITIDGNPSDWGSNLKYIEDEKVAVGVTNDNDYFYLCLTTNDVGKILPMFRGGLTVWVENDTKDDNMIGIKYPLHNIVNEAGMVMNPDQFREKGRGMMVENMIKNQDEIRILNKDNFPLTVISTSDSSGLTAKLGYNNYQFVYELRVPVKIDAQNKYGINASPGDKLVVKFETGKPEIPNFNGRGEGGGMGRGGMGGGEFGNGRRGGGMRPGGGGERPSFEPMDFSVEVTLK